MPEKYINIQLCKHTMINIKLQDTCNKFMEIVTGRQIVEQVMWQYEQAYNDNIKL